MSSGPSLVPDRPGDDRNHSRDDHGDEDPYIPVRFAEAHRRAFPSARYAYLVASGHWPFLDDPEAVSDVVLPFLREQIGDAGGGVKAQGASRVASGKKRPSGGGAATANGASPIFEPFTVHGVEFANRIVRSSIGGRLAYYDGSVNPAWARFERRFAEHGVAAVISATMTVDDHRWAPLEYPKISQDRFIKPISEGVRGVQALGCRYILQIGDPGYQTQAGLFSEREDESSSSAGFDLLYGYRSVRRAMTAGEIEATVEGFGDAARRVREAGCDGVEVTASKGYLIHQFLNPGINRRTDRYGGSVENRFRLLQEVTTALGVDYLHISNGFGFPNPMETPGSFPVEDVTMFFNSLRHLSKKAAVRSTVLNLVPSPLLHRIGNIGWGYRRGMNLPDARLFKHEVGLP
jgi:hypothetical protein